MTKLRSNRALKRSLRPVLEANRFELDARYEGVVATRDRRGSFEVVRAIVTWTLPRSFRITVSVHDDALNEFLRGFGDGRTRETPHAICNLRTFEPGANPFPDEGVGTGWQFEGDEPSAALIDTVRPLLDSTLKGLESIRDVDATADLIRDHDFGLSVHRSALALAGALAHARRFDEAARICRAAMTNDAVATAHFVGYNPQQRPILQRLLDYCEERSSGA